MATHGKTRDMVIRSLGERKPFKTSGSLRAIAGAADSTGQMDDLAALEYSGDRLNDKIAYTVISYATPIAWVTTDGTVKIPGRRYSSTTLHQQNLCQTYLVGPGETYIAF